MKGEQNREHRTKQNTKSLETCVLRLSEKRLMKLLPSEQLVPCYSILLSHFTPPLSSISVFDANNGNCEHLPKRLKI